MYNRTIKVLSLAQVTLHIHHVMYINTTMLRPFLTQFLPSHPQLSMSKLWFQHILFKTLRIQCSVKRPEKVPWIDLTPSLTWIMSNHNGPLYVGMWVSVLTQCLVNPVPLVFWHHEGDRAWGRAGSISWMSQSSENYRVDENDRKFLGRSWDVKNLGM